MKDLLEFDQVFAPKHEKQIGVCVDLAMELIKELLLVATRFDDFAQS